MNLPLSRSKDIVVQDTGKEVLIYDLVTRQAYNLDETSSVVFRHCDGETTFVELNAKYKLTADLIYLTLNELSKKNLLTDKSFVPPEAMNRREVIKKIGLASLAALPVIASLVAPHSSQAAGAVCPAKSPNPKGLQAGKAVGEPVTTGGGICTDTAAGRNLTCNVYYGGECCSETAVSADKCADNSNGSYTYSCICS